MTGLKKRRAVRAGNRPAGNTGWRRREGIRRIRTARRQIRTLCRQVCTGVYAHAAPGGHRHTRLCRRLRWCVLVMLSRRRVVEFPLLGPVNLNGARLWLLCLLLAIGGLVYEA